MTSQRFDVSYTSIFRILLVVAVLFFAYLIRDVIGLVFVAIFLSAAITPWVNWFHRHRIPRALAVLIIYLIAFAILSIVVISIVPVVVEQVNQLSVNFPEYYERVVASLMQVRDNSDGVSGASLQNAFDTATSGVVGTVTSVFGGLVSFAALLVLMFYMVINEKLLVKFIRLLTPTEYRDYAVDFMRRAQVQLGRWLRGQLFLMLFITVLTYVGLTILGIKYALVLALIAGLLELIPYAGPILSAIPAIIIALTISPLMGVFVVVLYFVIQQIENNFLVPKVMQHALGLNPLVTIIAILIGAKLGGIVGVIIAVPVATMASLLITDFYDQRHKKFNVSQNI